MNFSAMKRRLFLLLLFVLVVISATAYTPIVVEGYSWNVVFIGDNFGDNIERFRTHVEKIEGDSVINGVTYKKLWRYYLANPEKRTLEGLLREDVSEQKVWAYGNGLEALVYDFGVEIGDTISLLHWLHEMKNINSEEIKDVLRDLIVIDIEMVNIADLEPIKKITLCETKEPEKKRRKFFIYERFGSRRGWLFSDFAEVEGGGSNIMMCAFDANGELLFKPQTGINMLDTDQDCIVDTSYTINRKPYKSMVLPGYSWNIVNRRVHLDGSNTIEYKTHKEKIVDYEYPNDKLHWTLYRSTDDDLLEYEFIAHISENIYTRKVFALIDGKEYLLYDFDCEVGDTIKVLKSLVSAKIAPELIEMTIKDISKIEDLIGDTIRKFVATINDYPEDVVYYERYGSEHGWYTRPYDGIVGGGIDFLYCAWGVQQNYLLFKPDLNNELDLINDCYLSGTGTNSLTEFADSQDIYYDTSEKAVCFNMEHATSLAIYDVMGKVIKKNVTCTTNKVYVNLNAGIYIVALQVENNKMIYSKIIAK